ncbi:MAG: Hsp20/alpha crystallin family protein [Candidatus Schekmanbacteria bacterium]|nr:Hsp20/alpha crystallin family protein [Candidatus Schekmanbacteria bacterium]
MGIVRWDPFRDLMNLQDRMNKLFDESLHRVTPDDKLHSTWNPAVDIYETKDKFIVLAELPGMKHEDIQVEINNNTLTLRGERKLENEIKEESYHCLERSYGSFSRSFCLPATIRQENIKASLKEGVLELIIPKSQPTAAKQINIE